LDLAWMFLSKHMNAYTVPSDVPLNIAKLCVKILAGKGMYDEATQFIHDHKEVFVMDLERSRQLVIVHETAGRDDELIKEIMQTLKMNYERADKF
jgi:hypothetical protein